MLFVVVAPLHCRDAVPLRAARECAASTAGQKKVVVEFYTALSELYSISSFSHVVAADGDELGRR